MKSYSARSSQNPFLFIMLLCAVFGLSSCDVLNPEPTPILPAQTSLPQTPQPTITLMPQEEDVQTSPTSTAVPQEILSEELDYQLPMPVCFDLDEGEIVSDDDPACDIYALSTAGDENRLEIYPQNSTLFAFTQIFWEEPTLNACKDVEDWSKQAAALDTSLDYFICYQTGQAHYGALFVGQQSENTLFMNWKTWQEINPDFVFEPLEATPTPLPSMSYETFVGYGQQLDLDNGWLGWPGELIGEDISLSPGLLSVDGRILTTLVQPRSGFSLVKLDDPMRVPERAECEQLRGYSSQPVHLFAEAANFCMHTSDGRLGYAFIDEVNYSTGLTLSWYLWDQSGEIELDTEHPQPEDSVDQFILTADIAPGDEGILLPKKRFTKTWVLQNTGSTVWDQTYALVLTGGIAMDGPPEIVFDFVVLPGETVELSMDFQAPKEYGTYAGSYLLRNPDGELFGEQPFHNVIHVGKAGVTAVLEKGQSLSLGECFDLDSSLVLEQEDPLCDLSLTSITNSGLLELAPDYYASFAFMEIFAYRPDLSQCVHAPLSSESRYIDLRNWYVCYRSNSGQYGWLYLYEMEDGSLIFDWKRFEEE